MEVQGYYRRIESAKVSCPSTRPWTCNDELGLEQGHGKILRRPQRHQEVTELRYLTEKPVWADDPQGLRRTRSGNTGRRMISVACNGEIAHIGTAEGPPLITVEVT